ncbi:neutral zinc metallopeptidase [Nonomuraea sp. SYSU D8015]|uniref:neutral zinc metallopeptidase n=1 Tax=Nonomuraea sp. SYSU D8015 TaxID=2593644 RepID=UPI00166177B6|nr:neutral zinc metallopeptidase [Nonomuraea sp. SYSU D8015]
MKLLKIAALTCVALMAPMSGTAFAYPVKDPKLTENPLYDAGPLPTTTCEERPVKRNDRKLARAYIDAVIACLETTWEQHLTKAGLSYEKVKVRHMDRIPKKYCGLDIGKGDSQAWWCARNDTLVFQLGKDWLDDPSDLWLFETAAGMYGYHVMKLVGIFDSYKSMNYRNKSEYAEQERRKHLQNDCLGAAFMKSVWPMGNRTTKDWNYLLTLVRGDGRGEPRWYGKTGTIKAWMRAGFATGDPGSCNTWAAPSSKVA